jgi:hypothetical protein
MSASALRCVGFISYAASVRLMNLCRSCAHVTPLPGACVRAMRSGVRAARYAGINPRAERATSLTPCASSSGTMRATCAGVIHLYSLNIFFLFFLFFLFRITRTFFLARGRCAVAPWRRGAPGLFLDFFFTFLFFSFYFFHQNRISLVHVLLTKMRGTGTGTTFFSFSFFSFFIFSFFQNEQNIPKTQNARTKQPKKKNKRTNTTQKEERRRRKPKKKEPEKKSSKKRRKCSATQRSSASRCTS